MLCLYRSTALCYPDVALCCCRDARSRVYPDVTVTLIHNKSVLLNPPASRIIHNRNAPQRTGVSGSSLALFATIPCEITSYIHTAMATKQRAIHDTNWQQVMDAGDETAFRELVRPYIDTLIDAAKHDLDYYIDQGYIQVDDFTPEEVVGEALIQAWTHRQSRPDKMSLKGWLLGNMYRTLRLMVEQEHQYEQDKAISLDTPVVSDGDENAVGEQFWEWYQPDAVLEWEDVIPGSDPVDIEVPLYATRESFKLNPDSRHVLIMHDEFEMDVTEVAAVMNRQVQEIKELLDEARANLREMIGSGPEIEEVDQPAPPEGSDE